MFRNPVLTIIFLLINLYSRATVFTVTNNADSGPGSLRDAITQAAANGTAVQDQIVFSISDLTEAGRTIFLISELPALSGNLVLDGSTQPGAVFGISNAKIKLTLNSAPATGNFTCLLVQDATNVEIYGLYLSSNFQAPDYTGPFGIRINNSTHITIGAADKGNVVNGWLYGISNNHYDYSRDYSGMIAVKSNMLGVSEFGSPTYSTGTAQAIAMTFIFNLEVGGTMANEGNQIFGGAYCIRASHYDSPVAGSFFVKIINNKMLTDPTGTIAYGGSGLSAIYLNGNAFLSSDSNIAKTIVMNNVISGSDANRLFMMESIKHLVKIMGNRFGTDISGVNPIGTAQMGISCYNCFKVLVGSDDPADVNYFAGNGTGILVGGTPHFLITKNSFFCNSQAISVPGWSQPNPQPFVTINTYSPTLISGKSNPQARVEIFQNNHCALYHGSCQGKTYVTTVYADNNGDWSYAGPQPLPLIVTATTTDSATSEFPVPAINQLLSTYAQPTCGKSNGSITGMKVTSGTYIQWLDQGGNIVGTDTNLVNVPPGTYTLYASFGENGCSVNSESIILYNVQPPPALTVQPLNPTCGQKNGEFSISGNLVGIIPRVVNQLGDTVDFSGSYNNLNPGTYRLIAYPPGDYTCAVTYGPYTLTNQSGPLIDIHSAVIASATCHASNGSIRSLGITNVSGASYYRWTDMAGNTVGNSADLINVLPGQYQLKFKDGGGCDTITTDPITIGDQGTITIDTTSMLITKSKCSASNGSIQNITVQNGTSFQWINLQTGLVAGVSTDLLNMSSGVYQLHVSNASGCSNQTDPIIIPQETAVPVIAGFLMTPETCNRKDGSLEMNSFSGNLPDYTFQWKTTGGQAIGNNQTIQNLDSGYYNLYATDLNGCQQLVSTQHVNEAPAPTITNAVVHPEICGEKNGSIQLDVNGTSPFTFRWSDANGPLNNASASMGELSQGSFSVMIADVNHCNTNSPSYIVKDSTVLPDPPEYKNQIILKGNSASLSPAIPASGEYSLFDFYGSNTSVDQNNTGIFVTGSLQRDTTLYISFTQGSCTSPLTAVNIKVVTTISIDMPNAFTPNHDGHNDLFRVKYPDVIRTFKMNIYNRWGQIMYASEDPYKGWDGAMDGYEQPVGGYVWKILYTDIFGNTKQLNGIVLLIR